MGKDIHVNDSGSNQAEGTGAGQSKSTSTRSTSSRGRGRGRGETATGGSNEKIPKATVVEVPGQEKSPDDLKKEEQRKKANERKRKSRASAKAKSSASIGDATQLKVLLLTTSQIIGAREGMAMWAMTEQEVDQIVTPLYSILSKNDGVGQVMGEYADHIALIVASFTIFVPKFMMWKASRPKKEGTHYARKSTNPEREQGKQTRETASGSRPSGGQSTNNSTTFGGQLSELVPPSAGI